MGSRRTSGPNLGAPLLAHLGNLLTDPSGLHEFRQWFSRALWAIESGDEEAPEDIVDLFYAVENLIGVYDSGFWTVDRLIKELHAAALTAVTPALEFAVRKRLAQLRAEERPAA